MHAVATDKLDLEAIPDRAHDCHKFTNIPLPLVSVPQLCDSNMEVLFTKTSVTITNATGDTVLEGHRDPSRNLYMVPLEDSLPPPGVVSPMINDPIVPCHTAANAYEIQAVQVIIAYLHAAAGFPAKETWLRAVDANLYSSWPGISPPRVRRHLTKPEPTTFGYLKLIRKYIRSTQPKPMPPSTP